MIDYDEFLTAVAERGDYATSAEAEQASVRVLDIFAQLLSLPDAAAVAKHMPDTLAQVVEQANEGPPRVFDAAEFLTRLARRLPGAGVETARWDASAVLSTVADQLGPDFVADLLDQLGDDYADLFGSPSQGQSR